MDRQRRFIVTGAPGAGKTSLLTELGRRGYPVVAEAATDVILAAQAAGVDRPWELPGFIERIVGLQRARSVTPQPAAVLLFDRSPVCTLALAEFLGVPVPKSLSAEIDRIIRDQVYERTVFFVNDLGSVHPTVARRISYHDSLAFGELHRQCYLRFGYLLVEIPRADVPARADQLEDLLLTC